MKTYYKIFEMKDSTPRTLFHGVNKSRSIPLDQWITASTKLVYDSNCKQKYKSGFHVLPTKAEAEEYIKKFTGARKLAITPVQVDESKGIWPKSHSRHRVFLASCIRIPSKKWQQILN